MFPHIFFVLFLFECYYYSYSDSVAISLKTSGLLDYSLAVTSVGIAMLDSRKVSKNCIYHFIIEWGILCLQIVKARLYHP